MRRGLEQVAKVSGANDSLVENDMPLADLETRASPAYAGLSFPDPVVDLAVQPLPIDMEG